MKKLNNNEINILECCKQQIISETNSQFCYSEDVVSQTTQFNQHQVAGYLSSLQEKGYIVIDAEYDNQLMLTHLATEYLNDIECFDLF